MLAHFICNVNMGYNFSFMSCFYSLSVNSNIHAYGIVHVRFCLNKPEISFTLMDFFSRTLIISIYCSQVFLGQSGGLDSDGNELPRLVYVSREKRPGFQHHKKAGAMNSLVSSLMIYLSTYSLSYSCCKFGILMYYTCRFACQQFLPTDHSC